MLRFTWSGELPIASESGEHSESSIACQTRRFQELGDTCNSISLGLQRSVNSTATTVKATKFGGQRKALAGTLELVATASNDRIGDSILGGRAQNVVRKRQCEPN